jgi:tRNA 2-(methylsulfanyl)-N6-isopentenyladenosine37 hydroxylase
VLHLRVDTDPEWASRAASAIDLILIDHAHLEKKAASTAINLIFRYPEHPSLMRPLSELAREELDHFERVLTVLEERGVGFSRIRPSPYMAKLTEIVRKEEPHRLLDTLIVCAFIEARSCERMKVLAAHLEDERLRTFYGSLLASEARHHRTYVELAESIFAAEEVAARLDEIAVHEAEVMRALPKDPRLHNG